MHAQGGLAALVPVVAGSCLSFDVERQSMPFDVPLANELIGLAPQADGYHSALYLKG